MSVHAFAPLNFFSYRKMFIVGFVLLFCCLPIFLAQEFLFPTDSEEVSNITKLLEQKRGTENYEHLVDSVISRGILKLTLGLDRATLSNSGQTSDNIVFSPISVAGKINNRSGFVFKCQLSFYNRYK